MWTQSPLTCPSRCPWTKVGSAAGLATVGLLPALACVSVMVGQQQPRLTRSTLVRWPHASRDSTWAQSRPCTTTPSVVTVPLSGCTGKLEWASHDLSTIFIQRKNMVSPSFLRMVLDVIRFGKEAPQVRWEEKGCRHPLRGPAGGMAS